MPTSLTIMVVAALLFEGSVAAVLAQPAGPGCSQISTLLNGSSSFRGLNAQVASESADIAALQKSLGAMQAELPVARNVLSAAIKKNDAALVAYEQEVVAHLEDAIRDGTISLTDMTGMLSRIQQQRNSLQAQVALRCASAAAPAAGSAVAGGTSAATGPDFSGNWVIHTMISRPGYADLSYEYDAVLVGPPIGPWVTNQTLRSTNNASAAALVGRQFNGCNVLPLGNGRVGYQCPSTNADGSPGPPVICPGGPEGGSYAGACSGNVFRWEMHRGSIQGAPPQR